MTPEHWQHIERLYHDALEQPEPQRAAWLEEACAGDVSLRGQVEVLLAANDEASGFLGVPVLAHQSNPPAAPNVSTLRANERVSHYRILSKLGVGGMGEVYLAYDETLERQVALKVLPQQFTREPERLQRFIREGKAASALNHPNIITIHEIGKTPTATGEAHFIVTEFVAGKTLRQHLRKGKLPHERALDCAKQIASALAAAHAAGIVHRDIKPENVMVRPDGLVKVLDFGLAKLTEKPRPAVAVDTEADTMMRHSTGEGVVMGTTLYMSPEQARGLEVDARSDLFSLGSVLYELLTGRAPFKGATMSDILVGILDREPAPLVQHDPTAPRELQNVINKALRKDRDQRYQSARELLSDLKPLQLRMESQSHWLEDQPTATGQAAETESGKRATATVSHEVLSSALIVAELKRHKGGLAVTLAMIVLVLAGLFYGTY
ncbi:MAG: serine/threonine protein kinase, partial [Acidobacteria bacterium]|nr:serine/threonine protein kinase [Acidobacteriota bacterium]